MSAPVPSLAPPPHPAPEVLVLAAADVADNLVGLDPALAEPGVRVLKASGGREALDLLLRHDVAVGAIAVRIDGRSPDAVAIEVENGGTLPERVRANPFVAMGETRGGAGLYIVDQIARAHGGGVVAEASGGRTVFTVRLPRRAGES